MNIWSHGMTKKHYWGVVQLVRSTNENEEEFDGDTSDTTSGTKDGLILLTRKVFGPLAFMYFRAPRHDKVFDEEDPE